MVISAYLSTYSAWLSLRSALNCETLCPGVEEQFHFRVDIDDTRVQVMTLEAIRVGIATLLCSSDIEVSVLDLSSSP